MYISVDSKKITYPNIKYNCHMNAWKKLEDKIESAKSKAKVTDAILEKELLSRCGVCGGRMRPQGTEKLVCERCGQEKLNARTILKRALEAQPGLTAMELAEQTGIPRSEIYAYLDDGFLELSRSSVGILKCEICGTKILNGTVCNRCKQAYNENFGAVNVREGKSATSKGVIQSNTESKVHYMGSHKGDKRFKR